ncbi:MULTISPECIES: hypothetical protein [unclassified Streptomyces]|uniref:hypothetical protein n=1 Tax=unclassified Streptomyces TaxID=2593676 RepID=UPI0004C16F2D|nr:MULTISPECIES: hypothetical protein [unclassified Streptomyces]
MGSLKVTVCSGVLVAVAGGAAALAPAAYAGEAGSVSVIPASPAPGSDVTLRVTGCAERTAVAASTAFVADARLTVTDAGLTGDSRVRSTLEPGTYAVKVTCGAAERTGTFTVRAGEGRPRAGTAPGASGQPPAHGTAGRSSAPGAEAGQPPAPGTGGQPPVPEGGGRSPVPHTDGQSTAGEADGQSPAEDGDGRSSVEEEDGQSAAPGEDGQSSAARRPAPHTSPVAPVEAGGGGAADLVTAAGRGAGPGAAQGVTGLVLAGIAAVVVALSAVRRRSRGTD